MLLRLKKMTRNFLQEESAPTFLEYALLIMVIALVVIGSATAFGLVVAELFERGANAPGG